MRDRIRLPALLLLLLAEPQACTKTHDDAHAAQVAERVRAEFLHAWDNYERYAWGHDDLRPLSKTAHDWYGEPLLMTPVDALDTLVLMKLNGERGRRGP